MPKKAAAKTSPATGDGNYTETQSGGEPMQQKTSTPDANSYISRTLSSEDVHEIKVSVSKGSLEFLPESTKAKLSADELRQLLGIEYAKEDLLSIDEARAFFNLWRELHEGVEVRKAAASMNFGILHDNEVTIPLMIEQEIKLKRGTAGSEQPIDELLVCAGSWLIKSMRENNSPTLALLARILELRAEGKEPKALKYTDLSMPTKKGRKKTHNALENIARITAIFLANKYLFRQLRVPREEFKNQFNYFAKGAGLGDYKITETALSRWIKQTGWQPFIRKAKSGPEKGKRQTVRVKKDQS